MSALLSSLSALDWIEIVGTFMVLLGCAGEIWAMLIKEPFNPTNSSLMGSRKKHFVEHISICVLTIGVFIELATLPKNLMEVAKLEQSNLELRSNIVSLEAAVQWRTIKPAQRAMIRQDLQKWLILKKSKILLTCQFSELEAKTYMYALANLLKECGFETEAQPNIGIMPGSKSVVFGLGFAMKFVGKPAPQDVVDLGAAFKRAGIDWENMGEDQTLEEGVLLIRVGAKPNK